MSNLDNQKQKKTEKGSTLISVLVVVAVLWLMIRWVAGKNYDAIDSIFSALAFAAFIYSVSLQRKELISQREELELQRKELSGQKEEFKQQNLTLKYQRFENTFFNLTQQYNRLNKVHFSGKVTGLYHNDPFRKLKTASELRLAYNYLSELSNDGIKKLSPANIVQDEFGAHIRTFETIIEFIITNKTEAGNQMKYFKIFFSQLTNFELILYFYHFFLRLEEKPLAFKSYWNILFNSLHTSPIMPSGHVMELMNDYHKSIQEPQP